MNDFERMISGRFYNPDGESIIQSHQKGLELQQAINLLPFGETQERTRLMKELIPDQASDISFFPPFHCEYGCNIKVGKNLFMNFDCIILDVAPVTIGDNVMMGSRVTLATPMHPLVADERIPQEYPDGFHDLEYAKPITIGDNVWLASNVTVCGGVNIGSNSVIGAGSVVSRDVTEGVIAAGVPCRIIRKITDSDRLYPLNAYLSETILKREAKPEE